MPVRRKFLKSNTTELNNILCAFERIVLVYPEVSFTFHNNGVEVFNLKASNTHQRIIDVFGKKINQELNEFVEGLGCILKECGSGTGPKQQPIIAFTVKIETNAEETVNKIQQYLNGNVVPIV